MAAKGLPFGSGFRRDAGDSAAGPSICCFGSEASFDPKPGAADAQKINDDPREFFMQHDLNGDEALSPSEFFKMRLDVRGGEVVAADMEFFHSADNNTNGVLEYDELVDAYMPLLQAQVPCRPSALGLCRSCPRAPPDPSPLLTQRSSRREARGPARPTPGRAPAETAARRTPPPGRGPPCAGTSKTF